MDSDPPLSEYNSLQIQCGLIQVLWIRDDTLIIGNKISSIYYIIIES